MRGRIKYFGLGMNKKQGLTLELDGDFRQDYEKFKDCDVEIKVTKFREKRSINANDFMWSLCSLIAEKLSEEIPFTKTMVYQDAVKSVGVYCQQSGMEERFAKTMRTAWEERGSGWVTEKVDRDTYRFYYGSSRYNTKQMSRLIDYLLQQCRDYGIETRSKEEIDSLLNNWGTTSEKKGVTTSPIYVL